MTARPTEQTTSPHDHQATDLQDAQDLTRPGTKLAADRARLITARGRNIGVVAAARKLLTYVYYGLRDGEIRALAKGAV
jgi:hypothetical protein